MWLGCEIGGRGEEDAVFEVWEEEVFAAGDTSDEAAGVFGAGEIKTIHNRVRWCGCLTCRRIRQPEHVGPSKTASVASRNFTQNFGVAGDNFEQRYDRP